MNVRFAEPCRANPMDFEGAEWDVLGASVRDGLAQKELALACQKDIFIGVFFDGTNNKYRDTPGFACQETQHLQ